MARVVLEHIEKAFAGGVRAVDDFSLHIESGEFVVLVGPSGSGKTTLLRMIAGLEQPTAGTIAIGGREVNRVAPRDRNVAMVFQGGALYPHLDAFANMGFSLSLRRVPKAAIRHHVLQIAELLGITHLLDRKPRQLSGGEAQRVALGRALVRRPDCFLFDEPMAGLDAPLRATLRSELKQLQARLGITTLYVTHDQEEAMTMADRLVVLHHGRIQQAGQPLELYRQPRNLFVARFLGSPPINLLPGTVVSADGRWWFDDGQTRMAVPGRAASALATHAGQPLTLGVRPEAIAVRPIAGQADNALPVAVRLLEPLGDRTDVHLAADRHPRLIARLDSRDAPSRGAEIAVHLDLDRLHFFDREGNAIFVRPGIGQG